MLQLRQVERSGIVSDNRCDKHGTFSGNVGCPFCRDEKAAEHAGQSDPQERAAHGVKIVGGGGVEGVQTLSVRESNSGNPSTVIITKDTTKDINSVLGGDNA